jgi:ubiquinone/menaquinone biosynthesis C-methylase UbiE
LTAEELERIRAALLTPALGRTLLQVVVRAPRLIPEIAGAIVRSASHAFFSDNAVIWLLQSARVRLVVPQAATGVSWRDETFFIEQLRRYLTPDVRALELGCGGGRASRHVAGDVHSLVASDVSKAMLREAKANLQEFPNVRFVQTQGFALKELPDDAFDVVFAHGVLGHLDPFPLLMLLAATRRVLVRGGHCVANFRLVEDAAEARAVLDEALSAARRNRIPISERPYTKEQIIALFNAAGFGRASFVRDGEIGGGASAVAVATAEAETALGGSGKPDKPRATSGGAE